MIVNATKANPAKTTPAKGSMSLAPPRAASGLDRWKGKLRIRLTKTTAAAVEGTEGVVIEFVGPRGPDFWQVDFPEVGVVNVLQKNIQVLDAEFLNNLEQQKKTRIDRIVAHADRALLCVTSLRLFKCLLVWDTQGNVQRITKHGEARKLVQLLKQRNVTVAQDVCD